MFHKTIVELQKCRKYIDKRAIQFSDSRDNLFAGMLDNISTMLTISIQDLARIQKALKYMEKDNEKK